MPIYMFSKFVGKLLLEFKQLNRNANNSNAYFKITTSTGLLLSVVPKPDETINDFVIRINNETNAILGYKTRNSRLDL